MFRSQTCQADPSARRLTTRVAATIAIVAGIVANAAVAAPLDLTDRPLFLTDNVAPLNMLVMGRDHRLYYEAYNDASDLNGDGQLDAGYRPDRIDYFGYFNSFACYDYVGGVFVPAAATVNKTCGNTRWSGDFLNYVTTSRIDALRRVLYGGRRVVDTQTRTVLERSYIPQDAHSWGKEYQSVARDGYDIRNYTPLPLPNANRRHFFANTTLLNVADQLPRLRVLQNMQQRIWEWLSIERPVAGNQVAAVGGSSGSVNVNPQDYIVRVEVCPDNANLREADCRLYPSTHWKPTGLLQQFGENDSMFFGLITGSYDNNTQGGILRKAVASITDEINPDTGQLTATVGVIRSIDALKTIDFGGSYEYSCGWISTRAIDNGECSMWGNPVGEMLYEAMRYFAGRGPTAAYSAAGSTRDNMLGLPRVNNWRDPYATLPYCSKPFTTVISDTNISYDSDSLPGVDPNFGGGLANSLPGPGLNVAKIGQEIWDAEFGAGTTSQRFIGQSGALSDSAPSPKPVSSLGDIRGLAPEEPTKQGSYYTAAVANYGRTVDISAAAGVQNVSTFAVALASPLPRIEIPTSSGRKVTLVPFAKSPYGCLGLDNPPLGGGGNVPLNRFRPTNQIVDFYVESITPTSGRFRINFEDVEQGADHDMDAIALYDYSIDAADNITITVSSQYAAGCIHQHMGYIISGTSTDGVYLVVRDSDTAAGSDVDYFLDVPPGGRPGVNWDDNQPLPLVASHTFRPGNTDGATLLKDPLWYAAKYGGFLEAQGAENLRPDLQSEWDENSDGTPDDYFLVTNALTLKEQLTKSFLEIIDRVTSASSASVNSGSISSETRLYQAKFSTKNWTGQLLSYRIDADTGQLSAVDWDAANEIPVPNSRAIVTTDSGGAGVPFRWNSLDATRQGQLNLLDGRGQDRLNYLRGDPSREQSRPNGYFRDRPVLASGRPALLGDIVSSSPVFVGKPPFRYRDDLEGVGTSYLAFRIANEDRRPMVYAGANDGMLHAFDGETGAEIFAYIPGELFERLPLLTDPSYQHHYYVDGPPNMGDVFFKGTTAWRTVIVGGLNKGGQGVYALDVTDPDALREANASSVALWEYTDSNDRDMGYSFSQPAIVRTKDTARGGTGRWAAVFGNGYNNTTADGVVSATGNAVLYIVDVETGALIRKIDTMTGIGAPGSFGRPNGLGTPAVVDINGDGTADYIFAGDLYGNLWKFDITSPNAANWKVAYGPAAAPLPLFVATDAAGNRQPITSRPEVGRGSAGVGMVVLIGTGKFLEPADRIVETVPADFRVQSLYGVFDRNTGALTDLVPGRASMTQQTILVEQLLVTVDDPSTPAIDESNSTLVRATSNNAIAAGQRGWYMDLAFDANADGSLSAAEYKAERVVSNPVLRAGRIIFTTLLPDPDPCGFGGSGWLMELDSLTGSRLANSPFDLNNDRQFNDRDYIQIDTDGDGVPDLAVPVSGVSSEEGMIQSPGILADDNEAIEFKYSPGTTGNIQVTVENPGAAGFGRQSWRQIR